MAVICISYELDLGLILVYKQDGPAAHNEVVRIIGGVELKDYKFQLLSFVFVNGSIGLLGRNYDEQRNQLLRFSDGIQITVNASSLNTSYSQTEHFKSRGGAIQDQKQGSLLDGDDQLVDVLRLQMTIYPVTVYTDQWA